MAARFFLPTALGGVAVGIFASDAIGGGRPPTTSLLLAAAALTLVVAVAPRRWRGTVLGCVLVAIIASGIGWMRGAATTLPAGPGTVSALVGEREWLIAGTVADDPRPRSERLQLVLDRLAVADPSRPASATSVRGRILVWLPR